MASRPPVGVGHGAEGVEVSVSTLVFAVFGWMLWALWGYITK